MSDNSKIIEFPGANINSPDDEIKWLRDYKRKLKADYRKMFNGMAGGNIFNELWQGYVDINPNLIEAGLPPIDIPDEMDYTIWVEYLLNKETGNYTKWYKSKFKEFCEQMQETIATIEKYIEDYDASKEKDDSKS
ncbi:MAG: hypothetical protein K6F55_00625 [Eubacterium sp.]|nr:hypothetical protein [Eubacterium sp.]